MVKAGKRARPKYGNRVHGDYWHVEKHLRDMLDKRHPAAGAFIGLLTKATHKRAKMEIADHVARLVARGMPSDRAKAKASKDGARSTTLSEVHITPTPEKALPDIQEVFDMMDPPRFPIWGGVSGSDGRGIPLLKPGIKPAKWYSQCESFKDVWDMERLSMDRELILHSRRPDKKTIQFEGTNKQESKHNHMKKALDGVKNGLRGGNARHMQHTFIDNMVNYNRNFGIELPPHSNVELMLMVHDATGGDRYGDIIGLMAHVDTDEPCFGSSLLTQAGRLHVDPNDDDDLNDDPDDDDDDDAGAPTSAVGQGDAAVAQADAQIEAVVDAGASQYASAADRETFREVASSIVKLARAAKKVPSVAAGSSADGPTGKLSWIMKSPLALKACLGAPFHTYAEVYLHHRLRALIKGRNEHNRLERLTAAFNELVPQFRKRGYQLSMKTTRHVKAHEDAWDNCILGYRDFIDALAPLGKDYMKLRARLEEPVDGRGGREVHAVEDRGSKRARIDAGAVGGQQAVVIQVTVPAAGAAAATSTAAKSVSKNVVGTNCLSCDQMLALGPKRGTTHAWTPTSGTGVYHTATFCPVNMVGVGQQSKGREPPATALSDGDWDDKKKAAVAKSRKKKNEAAAAAAAAPQ